MVAYLYTLKIISMHHKSHCKDIVHSQILWGFQEKVTFWE